MSRVFSKHQFLLPMVDSTTTCREEKVEEELPREEVIEYLKQYAISSLVATTEQNDTTLVLS